LLAAALAGCTYYDDRGPRYAPSPAPDAGYGVVYVYRPKKQWGAANPFITVADGRVIKVWAGQYAVLVAREGIADILDVGTVKVSHDTPTYVRVEFDELVDSWNSAAGVKWKVKVVGPGKGESDLADLRLGAGGRGRYPDPVEAAAVAAPTPPSPATPK